MEDKKQIFEDVKLKDDETLNSELLEEMSDGRGEDE